MSLYAIDVLLRAPGTARAAPARRRRGTAACEVSCFSMMLTASFADELGVVALLLQELAVALPVDQPAALAGEVVHLADDVAVEVVEAAVLRPVLLVGVAEVPLADHRRLVADVLQRLRQRALVGRQAVGVAGEDHQRLQAVAHRIAAGHQRRARRRADGLAVERLEPHAALGQRVDVRRLDLAAAIAEVGVAEVVGEDDDDVRPTGLLRLRRDGARSRRRRQASRTTTVADTYHVLCVSFRAQWLPDGWLSASSALSTVKLPGRWRGGNSLKLARKPPTICCVGTARRRGDTTSRCSPSLPGRVRSDRSAGRRRSVRAGSRTACATRRCRSRSAP